MRKFRFKVRAPFYCQRIAKEPIDMGFVLWAWVGKTLKFAGYIFTDKENE